MSETPVSVFDVAKYIVRECGAVSAMKLHKLVYYSQAWSLVWDDCSLFRERIEAWISGPVVPRLYRTHRGKFLIGIRDIPGGNIRSLDGEQRATIDTVLDFYGGKDSQWLSDLTHMEKPWRKAREGLANNERGNQEITLLSMSEYYSSLHPSPNG